MAKTHEFKGIIFTEVPKNIVEKLGIKPGDELNFKIKNEEVVVQKQEAPKGNKDLTEDEKKLLQKLISIRHSDRKTNELKKLITESQKAFESLVDKNILFKYQKSGEELIGIDREYYSILTKQQQAKGLEELEAKGYLILEDKKEIYRISKEIEASKKQVKGVMGFDKKLYLVTEKKFKEVKKVIEDSLKQESTIKEASKKTRLEEGLIKAMIELMKEEGEIIEKRKGVYKII